MPAILRITQAQHFGGGTSRGLVWLVTVTQAEQQELTAPWRDADKQVLAQFDLLGAASPCSAGLTISQGRSDIDSDGFVRHMCGRLAWVRLTHRRSDKTKT